MGYFVLIPAGVVLVAWGLLFWVRRLKKATAKQVMAKFSQRRIYGFVLAIT
jgi:hypothetical protein